MSKSEEECAIDLDPEWVSSLKTKVELIPLRKHLQTEPQTIFRVPANMKEADPDAFEPKLISFGPFHREKPMDHLKLRYLRRILRRNPNKTIESYLKAIKTIEPRARSSYSEAFETTSNDFVEMLLLDGCFIVELFLMQLGETNEEEDDEIKRNDDDENEEKEDEEADPVLTNTWTLPLIEFDMLMLENQLPFVVLQSIFDLAAAAISDAPSLTKLTLDFFSDVFTSDDAEVPSDESVPKFYHILHLLHARILPSESRSPTQPPHQPPAIRRKFHKIKKMSSKLYHSLLSSIRPYRPPPAEKVESESDPSLPPTPESVPCATELAEAGVKFKKKEAVSFLDVTFSKGVMEMPPLRVYDETNSLFRNLIAFEQCFPDAGTHVAVYAVFMDCLIDTEDDVNLLHRHGCIVNGLGNDEDAAALFNRLCKEVAIDYESCYLARVFKDVRKHCDSTWNKNRAKLMHDYFSNPWSALSLAGALIVIVLTFVQTAFAIVAYFKPP